MKQQKWQEHRLNLPDHEMHWYESGSGSPILFLHGCYDNVLYRSMAELFSYKYRCILFDQRGYGDSMSQKPDEDFLHIDRHLDDIERLVDHLGLDDTYIIGHSWGAALGVMYAGRFPHRIRRLVLIGMGPLTKEMRAVYRANVLRRMHAADRDRWHAVNQRYKAARLSGKGVPSEVDEANIRIWSPVMFYSLATAEQFIHEYLQAGGWRRHGWNATGFSEEDILENAHKITAPVLILYGHQDYEPTTQAYLMKDRIRHGRISFINKCGHVVWKDQPDMSFREVDSFLSELGEKGHLA